MSGSQGSGGRSTVVGVFRERTEAERAIQQLKQAGFRDDQIGYAHRGEDGAAGGSGGSGGEVTTDTGSGSGALTGAATGGVLGALAGAAASFLIPGVGPVIAAGILGPLIGAAAGGAALGAVGGGLVGGLVTTGVPEDEAKYYDEEVRGGRILVTVKADGRAAEAERILRGAGAYDFANRGAAGTATTTTSTATTGAATAAAGTAGAETREGTIRVPEVEERLNVEKRETQQGEVRIEKRVEEHTETVPVELEREEVHVERRDTAERPVRPGEDAFQEGTIRVPVRGEEAVVSKEAVVTGEVVVDKERTTEREQVSDTVRKTEVHVDQNQQQAASGATGATGATGAAGAGGTEIYRTYAQQMRGDARYSGRRFEEAEADLQKDWAQRHPGISWDKAKAYVREAWTDVKSAGR